MQCTATAKSTGERCERDAIKGGEVCYVHGGSAPQVKNKAKERIEEELKELLPQGIKEIRRILEDEDANDRTKLKAIQDILDRVGPIKKHRQEQTGPDGGPIEKKEVSEEDVEDLEDYKEHFQNGDSKDS